jgi:hypothetical protein
MRRGEVGFYVRIAFLAALALVAFLRLLGLIGRWALLVAVCGLLLDVAADVGRAAWRRR